MFNICFLRINNDLIIISEQGKTSGLKETLSKSRSRAVKINLIRLIRLIYGYDYDTLNDPACDCTVR